MAYSNPATAKKEIQKQLRAIRKQGEKAAATRQSALAFLVRAGIYDKKGRLAARYR